MSQLLSRKRVLAAAIETTIGTAETLDATDATTNVVGVPQIQPTVNMVERESQGGMDWLSSIAGDYFGTAKFRTMLEWDGTTVPAWADLFFPACGWVKSGSTFTPRSEPPGTNVKTLTIGTYTAGAGNALIKKIAGAVGTFTVTLPTGRPPYIDWEFTGTWAAPEDGSILAPTYQSDTVSRFAGSLAEWNDVNLCISQATIDAGNEIHLRECPTGAGGYIAGIIGSRRPKITVDPESVLVASQNRWAAWLASTEYALELDVTGPSGLVSDAVISFDAPKAQINNLQEGERGRMVTDQIEFMANKNGATHDQCLSIVFTAKADA